jgi:hypothetical protein
VTFAELLKNSVLLAETVGFPSARVSEDISSFIQNGDFVTVFQFSVLVTPDYCIVDKGSIAGEVFHDSDRFPSFVLREDQEVPVGDCGDFEDAV